MAASFPKAEFLGVEFHSASVSEALSALSVLLVQDRFCYVVTPNVDHLVQLHVRGPTDPLWAVYAEADLCLCDSRILQLLASSSGIRLPLAPGSDLTAAFCANPPAEVCSVAVIGASTAIVADLRKLAPTLLWHHYQPPMGVRTDPAAQAAIIAFVEQTDADVIFFAIGAPQSELICHALSVRSRSKAVALCIGASLEFIVGSKRRAPEWMQHARLEWLFRLFAEPRRLGRRYLVEGPKIFSIWTSWLQKRRRSLASSDSNPSAEI